MRTHLSIRRASVLASLAALLLVACSRQEPAPQPVRAVRTMTVGVVSAGGVREYAAEVRARTESRLSFRVGGKLVRRQAALGDTVKQGQPLAQLDPQDLRLSQDAARAALQAATVNEQQARADYTRFKELRDQGFISSSELERRDTALKAAQAQLEQAQAQAGVQGNQAAYTTLVANAAGVITSIDAEVGAVVAAGTPVMQLAHEGPRDVSFSVPEDRVRDMRTMLGQKDAVKVRLWSSHGDTLSATVREIAASADPVTRTFLVKADIGRPDVRLGQTATVLVERPQMAGVSKLPLTAVLEQEGKPVVWVLDRESMTVKSQQIQVAGAEGNSVIVSSGLKEGQTVVIAGVHVLSEGQKVKQYVESPTSVVGNAGAR
jgi:membrane fusion protein, multidrug efflux system